MNKTKKYSVEEFKKRRQAECAFMTCASFEERSITIAKCLDKKFVAKAFIFSTKATQKIQENSDALSVLFGNNAVIMEIVKNDPFSYMQSFYKAINEIIDNGYKNLYIDITTFTHEMLLILLKIVIKKKTSFEHIQFLYNGAKEYSVGDKNENKWLSKGCKDIRSVLGYPGYLVPKNPICVIILVGFEHERASALINAMEPDMIVIGHGKAEIDSVLSDNHIEPMKYFDEVHRSLFASFANMEGFEFSVKDVESTVSILEGIIEDTSKYDHIIVPLNTKTSTLAAGLVAISNPKVQVCYAEPEMYNNENYSKPSDTIVVYSLK